MYNAFADHTELRIPNILAILSAKQHISKCLQILKFRCKQTRKNIFYAVRPAKSDSEAMFCSQSYQGLRIDISPVH